MNSSPENLWRQGLADLDTQGLRRRLRCVDSVREARVRVEGRSLICFCSNNYLALANHPAIKRAAVEAIECWGWGAGASQLVSGYMPPHAELADRLANFKSTEAALICSTGYQANLAAVRGLAGQGDVLLLDKLNHASIIDAARGSGAVVRVFPHKDYNKLERLLDRTASARRRVIVTDALFSMDGDFADLPRLVALKERYEALLCVDEAHATGVFGATGRGAAQMMGVEEGINLTVGTLSKGLGGIGGFVAGSRAMIDWLVNTAGAFIYTTAPPPAACAAAMAALDLVESEPWRREHVLKLADELRSRLHGRGFDTGDSASQIVPLMIGSASEAVALSGHLESQGLLVPAIRPPTVPAGKARLRISLSAGHEDDDIECLLAGLESFS